MAGIAYVVGSHRGQLVPRNCADCDAELMFDLGAVAKGAVEGRDFQVSCIECAEKMAMRTLGIGPGPS